MPEVAMLTYANGKIEIPEDLQHSLHLEDGARFRIERSEFGDLSIALVERATAPEWHWSPNDRWQALRGSLADHPEHDTSVVRAAERKAEEEHEERKFGLNSKR